MILLQLQPAVPPPLPVEAGRGLGLLDGVELQLLPARRHLAPQLRRLALRRVQQRRGVRQPRPHLQQLQRRGHILGLLILSPHLGTSLPRLDGFLHSSIRNIRRCHPCLLNRCHIALHPPHQPHPPPPTNPIPPPKPSPPPNPPLP